MMMLEWTAIDWRLKPTGEYVFLEANPSPMFLNFEHQTGFPIIQKLVKLLMNWANATLSVNSNVAPQGNTIALLIEL
jgi:hypothetical protein